MLTTFARLVLVGCMGMAGAACQGDSYGPPTGYQPAYSGGYYAPPPPRYAYSQPAPNYYYQNQPGYYQTQSGYYQNQRGYYQNQPAYNAYQNQGRYNQADGRRYTTVTVTNRGQNGYRDDVVQQQVVCGSQYYDGYRTRTAPYC